jgi:hypothetical protein
MMLNRCLLGAVVLLLVASSSASAAEGAAGKWTWTFKRPDGKEVKSVLTLKQDGEKLTGVSKLDTGEEHPIENGKVAGDTVSFSITRERDGRKMTANYSGKLTADAITGKITTKRGDEDVSYDWKATRVND